MALRVYTEFTPLRLKLSRKEPVNMAVVLENQDDEGKRLTVQVILDSQLSLSKGGFKTAELVRIEELGAGESKRLFFDIFGKLMTKEGERPVQVRVQEHGRTYQDISNTTNANTGLIVEA